MSFTRRATLGAALALPFIGRAGAQAGEPLTFATPFGFIPDFIEMMNMVSGGHLARQGFAPRLIGAQGTSPAVQQLLANQASFVRVTAIDQFLAVSRGNAPLVSIATLYQGGAFSVISLRDRAIRDARDLRGKTVGIVSVGGSTELLLDIMLRSAGIPREEVRREVTGNSPGALQLVRQGRVDCFIAAIGVVVALRRANEPIEFWNTDRYAPMPGQVYMATRETIASRPEVVVRFLRALKSSCDEMRTGDLRAIFNRAGRDFEIPGIRNLDAAVELTEVAMRDLWMAQGEANFLRNVPALWRQADEGIRGSGIAAVPDVDALWTNEFIERALRA